MKLTKIVAAFAIVSTVSAFVAGPALAQAPAPAPAPAAGQAPAPGQPAPGGQRAGGPPQPLGFFVTSKGSGDGANLGGLAGADAHCQSLAAAAGAGNRTWRAYLSTQPAAGQPAVNARDRIGAGPWFNAKNQQIAPNVADLHGDTVRDRNQMNKNNAVDEKGQTISGAGDQPNTHDILTGSQSDGRAWPAGEDRTCRNWTSNSDGAATVGHHDRTGGGNSSWNQAHSSRGCSQANLVSTGGAGLFYCFATN